ncbi:hypothetical protein SANTM175S_02552 [Streptomyces antimycoticus]
MPDGQQPQWPITAGILQGIEDGWFTGEIAESAFRYQRSLEKGDKKVVGVNCHEGSVTGDLEILRVSHEVEREQVRVLGARKAGRDEAEIAEGLKALVAAAREGSNMIEPMLRAVRAEASLGETSATPSELGNLYGAGRLLSPVRGGAGRGTAGIRPGQSVQQQVGEVPRPPRVHRFRADHQPVEHRPGDRVEDQVRVAGRLPGPPRAAAHRGAGRAPGRP